MTALQVALYARVSSEQQAQTIDSQVAALRERIDRDGARVSAEQAYLDAGYSGSTLIRPALERLRDAAAAGEIDRLYVLSPDRLARKYAYQVMLVDELQRAGIELVFLNRDLGQSPEDALLLQVQGMIAEYERAKMLERSRRGKRHKARQGVVNVLGGAPYGYRYIPAAEGGGQARYEIVEEQAHVVRQVFDWVGRERLSLGEVKRRLTTAGVLSPRGKTGWDRTTLWGMLKNPAYQGQAAFGKTRAGTLRSRLRAQRGRPLHPRSGGSVYDVPAEDWVLIPVPAIVSEDLFATVQTQLEDNRRWARQGQRGARYLLQGLVVCAGCGYAYYGKAISSSARKGHPRDYAYYRCVGSDAYRFGGQRLCWNTQVRTDRLDGAVWQEVCRLLEDPRRLAEEYARRLQALRTSPGEREAAAFETQIRRVRQGIGRLIDAYAEGTIDKTEAEPRIRRFKERLHTLEAQAMQCRTKAQQHAELQLVIGRLEAFSVKVSAGLEHLDWFGRRNLIRTLVKRVEIDRDRIRVVFRIEDPTSPSGESPFWQDCWRRDDPALRRTPRPFDALTFRRFHGRFEPSLDVQQHPVDLAVLANRPQQQLVVDMIERSPASIPFSTTQPLSR